MPADLISGVVVALALIPEAIAFSIIAGLAPEVGLYASFAMTVTIACLGGRIAMISAATAAMALPLGGLVDLITGGDEARLALALEYVLAATLVTGLLQVVWGSLQIGRIMKYVPRAVLVGFVNALAILIFLAQLEQFEKAYEVGLDLTMYIAVAIGLGIIYLLPRLTKNISALKSIPSPLVAIVVLTVWTVSQGVALPTVGEMGSLPESLPFFRLPNLPFNFDTLRIVLPVALTLSGIGLLESFLTASVLDDMTDTNSDKNQEARGQGIANLVTGMFGGMAGCGMIGQSIINIKSGGRQRLSTLSAGVFLLFF
ncbi:MAG: SulP family inorganic anion transporter, partial [Cyanobacteria bacterium J06648_10]